MNQKPTIEDLEKALTGTSPEGTEESEDTTTEKEVETEDSAPLKAELERVKSKKTPAQKARDSLYFNALEAQKLGIDIYNDEKLKKIFKSPEEEEEEISDEDRPITKRELEEFIRKQNAEKSAIDLASGIQDPYEKELVQYHLQNTIKSTGDAEEDLKLAKALANSVKNKKIEELSNIKPEAKSFSSASGAVIPSKEPEVTLTQEEEMFLATGKITKEEILQIRQGIKI